MITIYQEKDQAVIRIEHGYPVHEWTTKFYNNCGHEFWAKLMAHNLYEHFVKEIQRIRREEYEQGWKDAKSKKAKKDFFKGVIS